ncbi:GC-rich sequence DNA-binding factor-like protein [Wolffia australiana]
MSGGSVKSRNFRRRTEEDGNGEKSPPPAAAIQRKTADRASKPRSLLSFADEEEIATAPPRSTSSRPPSAKPAASLHKVSTAKDRPAPLPKSSVLHSQPGEYTKEKLLALQKNARPLGSLPRPPPSPPPDNPSQPVFVLKGLQALVTTPPPLREAPPEQEEDLEAEKLAGLEIRATGMKDSPLVLDQAAINAIKKERLRQARPPPPDFISLDVAAGHSSGEEDGGEDEGGRGVFQSSLPETIIGPVRASRAVEEDEREQVQLQEEEDEDEERMWEEEQFRKGLGRMRFDEAPLPSQKPGVSRSPPAGARAAAEPSAFFSKSAETMTMAQQAAAAARALRESIGKLKEAHGRTLSSLDRTEENLSESLANVTTLEKSLSAADAKFVFMQQLRDFISVLCSFLQDKAPYIEELEDQLLKLNADRAAAARARRSPDEAAQALHSPAEVDEFGRDLSKQRRLVMERRAAAAARRQARGGDGGDLSSGEESEGEAEAYASCRGELLHTAELVFSDAAEEFAKVSAVKERLQEWKTLYGPSYRDAYMGASAAQIFAPYARLELLRWEPLREKTDFCGMEWHDGLFDFDDVVPVLVEEVALQRLLSEIRGCWDPMSTRMTEKAVFATEMVVSYLGGESEKAAGLAAEIKARLAEAAEGVAGFEPGVRLLRNVCLWKEVLAATAVEEVALGALVVGKLVPELRRMGLEEGVAGAERVVAAMAGFGIGGQRARPLVECVAEMGRRLEKRRAAAGPEDGAAVALARWLKKVLVELNEYDRARALLKAFNLREAL